MSDERYPCRVCGRNFNSESLARHERVCAKQSQKKPRKVFDSGRQRAAGSDIPYNKTMKSPPSHAPPPYSEPRGNDAKFPMRGGHMSMGGHNRELPRGKSNWRKQHADFIAAVRAAKAYGQALKTGGPLPPPAPPSENPDYVQCPTCGRRFNENAAARHIPFCAEQSNRVVSRKIPDSNAKMRANARSYVPPAPGMKPKSTSGGGGRGLMGTTTLADAGDYGYDNFPSQPARYGASQAARRSGAPSGGNGSGGAAGRYAAANRQMVVDNDFDSYVVPAQAQGPRGSRLGGGVPPRTQPAASSGARMAPVSGIPVSGRGASVGGSSAFGSRSQGQQAVYLGSSGRGGGRQPAGMNGGYGDYDSMQVGGGKPVSSGHGGMGRPAASESGQFCYECGNPYPSKAAKFCVECGIKRI